MDKSSNNFFMQKALEQAKKAYKKGDVPVGAVIIKDNKIIAKAYNKKENKQNALYHAEVLAIKKACKKLKSFRLDKCKLFVTLEPCPMCAGAILNARIRHLFIGAMDPKAGAVGSKLNLLTDYSFCHRVEVQTGLQEEECSQMLRSFFKELREKKLDEKENS